MSEEKAGYALTADLNDQLMIDVMDLLSAAIQSDSCTISITRDKNSEGTQYTGWRNLQVRFYQPAAAGPVVPGG